MAWVLLTLVVALGSVVWLLYAGHRYGGRQSAPALILAALLVACIARTSHHLRTLAELRRD